MNQSVSRKGARRLADLIRPALEPALARRGMAQASLLTDWSTIVGERFAAMCEPARLQWPPRGPKTDATRAQTPATLWLRVAPGRGLDLQYGAPVLLERINAHLGWRCVGRLATTPDAKKPGRVGQAVPADHAPGARAQAAALTSHVEDERLRDALTRLGAGVIGRRPV